MIKDSMFFSERTITDYRDIVLDDVLKEYLLFKGTRDSDNKPMHQFVYIKDIIFAGLQIYSLKYNETNKKSVAYYCEREARRRNLYDDKDGLITVPVRIWNECDAKNTI